MPNRLADTGAHKRQLNMLALQIAGDFPGNRADAEYVLARIGKILSECVYDEAPEEWGRVSAEIVCINGEKQGGRAS